jgi:hypothetical protein
MLRLKIVFDLLGRRVALRRDNIGNWVFAGVLLSVLFPAMVARANPPVSAEISSAQLDAEITDFLRTEISAHVADIKNLTPPPAYVVGARTGGDFTWGTFMRAIMSTSALTGDRAFGGRDVLPLLGQLGLIDARKGSRTFAQLAAGLTLRHYGTDLKTNPLWLSLTPAEQELWRSLLDPARFYDRKTRKVINLPENYLGVASRVVVIDYQLGLISDRAFVDDVLDRAAAQFVNGALYSDDAVPNGRFDRYSQEYARFLYEAAETVGRKDITAALAPCLRAVMKTWWGLVGPDGCGYPWGRTIGAISYMDTMDIIAFLGQHPEFRPAPLAELASVYHAAWRWLKHDYLPDRHILNVFGFGRGNFGYMTPDREWQQTTSFFYKLAEAQKLFSAVLKSEHIVSFPAEPALPDLARFDFFRHGDRPAGAWLVRQGSLHFVVPITTGTLSGIADYLPAPHGLPGFAPPVEQFCPALTPYLELEGGRTIVAGDCADEIDPAADGRELRASWRRWAVVKTTTGKTEAQRLFGPAGELIDPGLSTAVSWKLDGHTVVRSEKITASRPVAIRRFWVMFTSRGNCDTIHFEKGRRIDRFDSPDGSVEVEVSDSSFPFQKSLLATGDSALGRGARGAIPLVLQWQADDLKLRAGDTLTWTIRLREL